MASSSRRDRKIKLSGFVKQSLLITQAERLLICCIPLFFNVRRAQIWNLAQKRISAVLPGHKSEIYSLAFSPDGRRLVSGSGDKSARMWDLETGTCVFALAIDDITIAENGPVDAGVTSVIFSPDGKLLAAGSLDTVVRIWDAETGQLLDKLKGHKDSVYSVAFSPDGKFLVSGSLDKTLKMFDVGSLKAALAAGGKDAPVGEGGKTTCLTTLQGHKVRSPPPCPASLHVLTYLPTGLRSLRRHFARRRLDRLGLERPRRAVLGSEDGEGAVHASRAQELGHLGCGLAGRRNGGNGIRRLDFGAFSFLWVRQAELTFFVLHLSFFGPPAHLVVRADSQLNCRQPARRTLFFFPLIPLPLLPLSWVYRLLVLFRTLCDTCVHGH